MTECTLKIGDEVRHKIVNHWKGTVKETFWRQNDYWKEGHWVIVLDNGRHGPERVWEKI